MQALFARTHVTSQLQNTLVARTFSSSNFAPCQHTHFDRISILRTVKLYAIRCALLEGRLLHAHILSSYSFFLVDVSLNNALINMYAKCSSMEDALCILARMPNSDVVSWNTLIGAFVSHRYNEDAHKYFILMQEEGVRADNVTCISMLSACANQNALEEGMKIHDMILANGFDMDIVIQNALINMYGRCGCVEAASSIFSGSSQDDIITWNAMISAYCNNGLEDLAHQLFYALHVKAMVPSRVTYISILSVFANKGVLIDGKCIHAMVVGRDIEDDVVVGTSLINLYGKSGSVQYARHVFNNMTNPNVVSWNALIAVHAQSGASKLALQLFYEMHKENFFSSRLTFVNMLDACLTKSALKEGKWLHVYVQANGLEKDLLVGNALMNMYGKCCSIISAHELFDSMLERNDITWNVMLTNYARSEQGFKAFELFEQMLQEGSLPNKVTFLALLNDCANQLDLIKGTQMHALIVSGHLILDNVVGNALVNLYSKCGQMVTALEMFEELHEHDVISWSAIIAGFAQQGQSEEALFFFNRMCQDGVMPNKITYVTVLAACSSHVVQIAAKRIHAVIMSCDWKADVVIGNALINLYGKCGCPNDARCIFDTMVERNTVSWTAMIAAYAQHGEDEHVLRLFCQMQQAGVRPNMVTFLSVISAWGHTGKVEEGYYWFMLMDRRFDIAPIVDHYNCLIDLAGRAGRLDEVEKLFLGMPSQVTIVTLMALLSACKYQADVERGEGFARCAFTLFPENAEPYIMLANIFSSVGRVEDAERVISRMKTKGLEDA